MIKKLGLPMEYRKIPEYFDASNIQEDTQSKNAVIEKLLRQHAVKTILDMTCGTGSQVFYLTKQGYQCTGSDFSPDLLKQARRKALEQKVPITFIDGDMRTLKVGKFDAVISIFNAIGHLTKSGFVKALGNIQDNLKEGGIYIFDILNLEAMTDSKVSDLAWLTHKKIKGSQILTAQCSTIDRTSGILTSYDTVLLQKNSEKPKRLQGQFSLQLYSAKELRDLLSQNGFEVVAQYDIDGKSFLPKSSSSILTVAKKKL